MIPVANVIIHAQQQKDLRQWTNRNFDPVNNVAADKHVLILEN